MSSFPSTVEELAQYDVIILSDCGRNTLTMYPDMFTLPMGPDRVQVIADYVRQGGSLLMAGGWMSYQGFQAKANYHGSAIEEVLPVQISAFDDRIETPRASRAGARRRPRRARGPVHRLAAVPGLPATRPKEGAEVLATIGDGDPLVTVWHVGEAARWPSRATWLHIGAQTS